MASHKINNSYESEPSSGSGGSSLSEHNDCHLVLDEENMQLPYLLKPVPSFENEITITTTERQDSFNHTTPKKHEEEMDIQPKKARQLLYGIPLQSSEESSFEGFGETPFGSFQRQLFTAKDNGSTDKTKKPTPGKIVFANFYDTIVEENSCNAVDMKLSNELPSHLAEESTISRSAVDDNVEKIPNGIAVELSFNGRIKSLMQTELSTPSLPPTETLAVSSTTTRCLPAVFETTTTTTTSLSSSFLNCSKLNESFILKKYSNEKSPDLFGEDDDDDDDDITEPAELIKHVHFDTSANQSINCPTELSFADDQTLDCTNLSSPTPGGHFSSEDLQDHLYNQNLRREREILRRIRKCLAGVPPPPSVTTPQLDLISAVLNHKQQIFNFFKTKDDTASLMDGPSTSAAAAAAAAATIAAAAPPPFSLFKPTHTLAETQVMAWKDLLGVRQHGLSLNLSKSSESSDYLSLAVVERFIGAETASSYRNSPSSAKKRNSRLKMLTQSPGNRLSHLAKRRSVFSSANLATTSQKSCSSLGPQIMLDKKKAQHRRKTTPKRMTPGSKKKHRKTPSSSARKRLFRCDLMKPGPTRETSKRALFRSPAKPLVPVHAVVAAPIPLVLRSEIAHRVVVAAPRPLVIKPEIAERVERSKRALFSPDTKSSSSSCTAVAPLKPWSQSQPFPSASVAAELNAVMLKRKRNLADDDDSVGSSKLFRGSSSGENLTPRALKIKSQSFCSGAGSSSSVAAVPGLSICNASTLASSRSSLGYYSSSQLRNSSSSGLFQRSHSDQSAQSNSLSENQRKKLLWAVSQALQEKKIPATHESFKQYASVLARVVRRIFQEYYQGSSTSNSETLLRLAKKYVYNVTAGKNADDIYFQAKAQIDEIKRQSDSRLSGYIGREEYQQRRQNLQSQTSSQQSSIAAAGSMQNLFTGNLDAAENSIDSFGFSQTSSTFCGGTALGASQSSFLGSTLSQDVAMASMPKQFPVQPNATLQNSSSKNNLGGLALRENVDCEQRRTSAQKNYFTGKDQRNVSPYATATSSTATSTRLGGGSALKPTMTTQTQLLTTTMTMAAKAKRQISFDS